MTQEAWQARRSIENLGSTTRLNLIFDTQKSQYDSVSRYLDGMDPRRLERWPYWQYLPSTSAHPRESHKAFYGMIIRKDDPNAARFLPPLDFRCGCRYKQVDANVLKGGEVSTLDLDTVRVKTQDDEGNEIEKTVEYIVRKDPNGKEISRMKRAGSGYSFSPATLFNGCDLNAVESDDLRPKLVEDMVQYAKNKAKRISFIGANPKPEMFPALEVPNIQEVKDNVSQASGAVKKFLTERGIDTQKLPPYDVLNKTLKDHKIDPYSPPQELKKAFQKPVDLGMLPEGILKSVGLKGENIPVSLEYGNGFFGVAHMWKNHKDVFCDGGELEKILIETLGNPSVRTALTVTFDHSKRFSGPRYLVSMYHPDTGAFCVMGYRNNQGRIVSMHRIPKGGSYPNDEWWI